MTLGAKHRGKRSGENPHAAFDEAGAGNEFTVKLEYLFAKKHHRLEAGRQISMKFLDSREGKIQSRERSLRFSTRDPVPNRFANVKR